MLDGAIVDTDTSRVEITTPSAVEGRIGNVATNEHADSSNDVVEEGQSAPDENGDADEETDPQTEPEASGSPSVATLLVNLAEEEYKFGVTPDGEAYALPVEGGHVVIMLRESWMSLRQELSNKFFRKYGRVPSSSACTDALTVLEGAAKQEEPMELHLRTASHGNDIYIDIGDSANHVVHLTSNGWSLLTTNVPVLFRRTRVTAAFPLPECGGRLNDLWDLLNIAESDRILILAYMVAALIQPNTPHPVLVFLAEQGTGKSSATRIVVALIDPSVVPLRKGPRDADAWIVAASGSWVVALDNLSLIPDWLSDALCRAATGDGDVRRALYTNAGLAVIRFRRCVIANGIDIGALRGDLAERVLGVTLQPIAPSKRLREAEINELWEIAYPGVLGALLDLCARVKAAMPDVALSSVPRMADFATLLGAIDLVQGTDGLQRYLDRTNSAAKDSLSADLFLARLREEITEPFVGTSGELFARVQPALVGAAGRPRGWPKTPREVTSSLRRNAPALRACGWTVEHDEGRNRSSTFRWTISPPQGEDSSGAISE